MSYIIEKATVNRKGFSFHKHEKYEIIVFKKGVAVFNYENKTINVKEGDVIIIPPNVTHCVTSNCEFEYYYVSGITSAYFNVATPTVLNFYDNEPITLTNLIYLNRYSSNESYLESLINSLVLFLSAKFQRVDGITIAINNITDILNRNFTNPELNVSSLLINSGYAEDYIRNKFKKVTGKTPNEFLTCLRINHAKKLISAFKNSASLSNIANLCGYCDYPYFSRKFKEITGVSPKKYTLHG